MAHNFSRNLKWTKVIGCLMLTATVGTLGLGGSATSTKAAVSASNVTTIPQVAGPIPVTYNSHPFTVGGTDLASHGYRLDEYFISGKANVYDWGANGTAATPQVRTPNAPYTTRMVIRRPNNPSKFSGNVWVELNNPSRGWDVEVEWPTVQEKVLRDGDIWVALTVKPNVIASLKRIDAKRYAPLSMANPLPPDKQSSGKLPGETGYDENLSKLYENGLVWDILSQTGALIRSKSTNNPLHAYDVKYVFATGESQTGFFLNTYAADFAENAKLKNGHTVYDGFVSVSGAGRTVPINQSVPDTGVNDPRSQLPSKHVPFMRIDSQGDVFQLGSYLWRRPDSDAPGAGYRMYEITGAPHGPAFIVNYQPLEADILKAGNLPSDVPYAYGGVEPKANTMPRQYIEPAMFANMERWVIKGIRPPHAEPLSVKQGVGKQTSLFGETINASFVKDQYGNVLGGVRSPSVDVPTATYYESATAKPGYPFAWSFGHQDDFRSETLQKIYGAVGTHQKYVAKVQASVKQLESQRWLEPQEGDKIIQQAELTPIP
ncbi:alpha/beta hydrolase domain-containing protein [Aneurinibacillus sp. Ricciae_BoGa-3]|uniref:alpha/beta hydrolase domain-containing protein n=1 Tax=Aneurinibacillus sp. Ricciae_BoGa-3 TaxID=3022697 RepID=UPI0023400D75|nr:alpha/beta hydrolase domain-containing protein [Aneurinibacillus sp. Ricciae_BoGa-3]WCK54961.1 alpha/beta hydrolase domain-containing protein [Aneurinibacillus sp. Ricciae_BoGa-3]